MLKRNPVLTQVNECTEPALAEEEFRQEKRVAKWSWPVSQHDAETISGLIGRVELGWRSKHVMLKLATAAKRLHTFVSPALYLSTGIAVCSCVILEISGGFGPCGPANLWGGLIWHFGFPIGSLGIVFGLVDSAVRTYKYFRRDRNGKMMSD